MFISSNHDNELYNNNEQNNKVENFCGARFLSVTNEVDPRAAQANQLSAMY